MMLKGKGKWTQKKSQDFKKSLRLMARRYSVFVFIVKGERQHFRLLLPPLSAHIAGAGALVIRRAAARSFYRWQRVLGSACVHTNVTSDFVGKSCVYAIDTVKLSCGWFNPSDIYKIGGSVMFRFCRKQFGLWRTRFWCSPQLWREQLKIIHMGA